MRVLVVEDEARARLLAASEVPPESLREGVTPGKFVLKFQSGSIHAGSAVAF